MSSGGRTETFVARIYKIGILRCVDVPREVSRVLGGGRQMAVQQRRMPRLLLVKRLLSLWVGD